RIELGEIENRLLQHEVIQEVAVVARENQEKEKYICAYVVSRGVEISELDLKSYLKGKLPEYMVPSHIIILDKMPLTANGKLNRKAFELGGHSLKAMVLLSKIHKRLNKELPFQDLFNSPTIKELSKLMESIVENNFVSIERVKEQEYYEASSAQKRMYLLQQFDRENTTYNMPLIFELSGEIDKKRIEKTFRILVERHEALRTSFEIIEDKIVQRIDSPNKFELIEKNTSENIEAIVAKFVKPFVLEEGSLFRVELVRIGEKTYLLLDMHHIISDGVSMEILTREFASLYNGVNVEPLTLQYKDFSAWQNDYLKSKEMKKQEEYWINKFNDEVPIINLPYDYERSTMQGHEGDSINFEVSKSTLEKLRELAKETGTTMYMVLLSAFNILLSKYSGQEEIVVGTPIAGRIHADLENVMGMFVNTLAFRNEPKGEKDYLEFLEEVKGNCLKAYENQSYQFEELVEKLNLKRDTSRNPLFDVMFNMIDRVTSQEIQLDGLLLKAYDKSTKISKFDLTLNALEEESVLQFSIEYRSKLFKKETIDKLGRHFIKLLEEIATNYKVEISEFELMTVRERNQILYEFNNTKAEYPSDKTVQELFEEQVERTPNNIAVVFGEEQVTYRELNEKANQLARVLRECGVGREKIVAIMVDRSVEMIVGILGIIKAGGAYLPIDPEHPNERIEYMLKDSQSKVLLTQKKLVAELNFTGEIIDLYKDELFKGSSANLSKVNSPSDLIYVIYTSGTTGNPKGVMI
ncbi:condensation domain-containing protein, partial [Bacillus mobilis]|uniref:condensation domain-containing protein n=1 Tax=Bacillus mobilis TaxID=2026190 RepID=UPI0022E55AF9